MEPTETLQSMLELPSSGSNTTQYLPARWSSTTMGSSFSSLTMTEILRLSSRQRDPSISNHHTKSTEGRSRNARKLESVDEVVVCHDVQLLDIFTLNIHRPVEAIQPSNA